MEIVRYPHPGLLTPTIEVLPDEIPAFLGKIREMLELMYEEKGVGLAAPQVDWSVKLFVINPTGETEDEQIFVNPRITEREGSEVDEEGCLSFPGIYAKVTRAESIVVEYLNEKAAPVRLRCKGILARIIQHELDHLENILLVHRMSQSDKFKNRRKLKELKAVISS